VLDRVADHSIPIGHETGFGLRCRRRVRIILARIP
jgi:hypothetical protein